MFSCKFFCPLVGGVQHRAHCPKHRTGTGLFIAQVRLVSVEGVVADESISLKFFFFCGQCLNVFKKRTVKSELFSFHIFLLPAGRPGLCLYCSRQARKNLPVFLPTLQIRKMAKVPVDKGLFGCCRQNAQKVLSERNKREEVRNFPS